MRVPIVCSLALLAGCATHHFPESISEDVMLVPADGKVEFAVDAHGRVQEVEFHCKADVIPQAAMRAVEAVLPGGQILDCEKEYHGGKLYYEVAKLVDGREVEVMVTPEGQIKSREVEVMASQVPDTVLEVAGKAVPGSSRTKVEEIRDGANNLVEYHIKAERSGIKYKTLVTPAGKVIGVFRETIAEIEVPVKG